MELNFPSHATCYAKRNTYNTTTKTYILQLLPHLCILMNQLGDLFLETFVLFHKKLIHGRHLPVHGLEP